MVRLAQSSCCFYPSKHLCSAAQSWQLATELHLPFYSAKLAQFCCFFFLEQLPLLLLQLHLYCASSSQIASSFLNLARLAQFCYLFLLNKRFCSACIHYAPSYCVASTSQAIFSSAAFSQQSIFLLSLLTSSTLILLRLHILHASSCFQHPASIWQD